MGWGANAVKRRRHAGRVGHSAPVSVCPLLSDNFFRMKARIALLSPEDAKTFFDLETAETGKNRPGVVKALKSQIEG